MAVDGSYLVAVGGRYLGFRWQLFVAVDGS